MGGSGVLKGSKGWGSKLKGVVLEFGRGVMEEVDFSRLEIMIELTFLKNSIRYPKTTALYTQGVLGLFFRFLAQKNSSTFRMSAHCLKILFKKSHFGVSEAKLIFSFYIVKKSKSSC